MLERDTEECEEPVAATAAPVRMPPASDATAKSEAVSFRIGFSFQQIAFDALSFYGLPPQARDKHAQKIAREGPIFSVRLEPPGEWAGASPRPARKH